MHRVIPLVLVAAGVALMVWLFGGGTEEGPGVSISIDGGGDEDGGPRAVRRLEGQDIAAVGILGQHRLPVPLEGWERWREQTWSVPAGTTAVTGAQVLEAFAAHVPVRFEQAADRAAFQRRKKPVAMPEARSVRLHELEGMLPEWGFEVDHQAGYLIFRQRPDGAPEPGEDG